MELRKTRVNTVEHDQPAETEVEGEIRELVRRDVVTDLMRQPENENEMAASSINSMLQRATATSTQEIDRLIAEMEDVARHAAQRGYAGSARGLPICDVDPRGPAVEQDHR
jgi:hypothetical protein